MSLERTQEWFEKCFPNPTEKNINTQLGVHFEEVAEMIEALNSSTTTGHRYLTNAMLALEALAQYLKTNEKIEVLPEKRQEFLDSLCDQAVTLAGCAHMQKMELGLALEEVNRSNFSKFVDGNPIYDENQKVKKGPDYTPPNLTAFI